MQKICENIFFFLDARIVLIYNIYGVQICFATVLHIYRGNG